MKNCTFFALVLASVGIVSAQNDIVVDNPQAAFEGKWDVAKSAKDRYGDDYKSAFCVSGQATGTATYRPGIVVPGKYNVEVMYPRGDNRSTNAPVLISFKGGTLKTNIDQRISASSWRRIASGLEFETGTDGFVQLSNNCEDKESSAGKPVVIADAFRFVLVSKTTTKDPVPSFKPTTANKSATSTTRSSPGWRFSARTMANGSGSISKNPDQPGYSDRDVLELQAKADKGFVFAGWTGDVTGFDNPVKVIVTNNVEVAAEFLPEAVGVILESRDARFDGKWAPNTQKWSGQRSDLYFFAIASTEAQSIATFTPKLPKAGKYDIYIYYLQGENRATKTTWEIVSKSGSSKVEIDQRANGRQWFQIASGKEFEAGDKGFVRVTGQAEPIPSVVVVDSVAFVYVGQ